MGAMKIIICLFCIVDHEYSGVSDSVAWNKCGISLSFLIFCVEVNTESWSYNMWA